MHPNSKNGKIFKAENKYLRTGMINHSSQNIIKQQKNTMAIRITRRNFSKKKRYSPIEHDGKTKK
jgi:hypothetical protein